MEPSISESSPECSKKAQIRVRELEHEIESLKSSLESSRQQSDRMKTLAEQAEERLNEIVEENKRLEEHFSRDMCETKQRKFSRQFLINIYSFLLKYFLPYLCLLTDVLNITYLT